MLEDYLFFPPLVKMRDLIDDGEIGDPVVGAHEDRRHRSRRVGSPAERASRWQFEQARDGRGMMVFDHGWHQLAVATWLFGPIRRIFAWLGRTEIVPGIEMDAPSTLVWEHDNGVRAVLEISFAIDTYFRSSHYTGDERVEVTGTRGYVRTNRISAQGIQEPAVVLYRDGETRAFHDLDDRPPDAFRASTDHALALLPGRGRRTGDGADGEPTTCSPRSSPRSSRTASGTRSTSDPPGRARSRHRAPWPPRARRTRALPAGGRAHPTGRPRAGRRRTRADPRRRRTGSAPGS